MNLSTYPTQAAAVIFIIALATFKVKDSNAWARFYICVEPRGDVNFEEEKKGGLALSGAGV